ncbi:hypothetical protein AD934_02915 [Gluconobacter oxydans]|uniref:Uncharacterized protein n=2 Tax=Gluconobacter TaxID=441 RepID=A0A149S1T6_GLUOY|nr:hypothetical protein AD934_02915 [Gluconobacter oxydans]KXV50607.1 hypothetical protein AD945_01565 [Gluconobacter albidus]
MDVFSGFRDFRSPAFQPFKQAPPVCKKALHSELKCRIEKSTTIFSIQFIRFGDRWDYVLRASRKRGLKRIWALANSLK